LSHNFGPLRGDDVIKEQKNKPNLPFFSPTHRKTRTQISNGLFSVQTRRLQESFECSNSSLAMSSGELSRVIASYGSRQSATHTFSDFGVKMGFLGHNFNSRDARKSIKDSIDAGDHVFFKKG